MRAIANFLFNLRAYPVDSLAARAQAAVWTLLTVGLALLIAGCGRSGGDAAPPASGGSTGGSNGSSEPAFPTWKLFGNGSTMDATSPGPGATFDIEVTGNHNTVEVPAGSVVRNISIVGDLNAITVRGSLTGSVSFVGDSNDIVHRYPEPAPPVSNNVGNQNNVGWWVPQ